MQVGLFVQPYKLRLPALIFFDFILNIVIKVELTNEKYGTLWSRDETILCFYLYCQIPFSRTNKSNPFVVELSNLLRRTIGSVVRKLGNFGAVDDRLRILNISGLVNYAKLDKEIFDEFVNDWEGLVSNSQKIIDCLSASVELNLRYARKLSERFPGVSCTVQN